MKEYVPKSLTLTQRFSSRRQFRVARSRCVQLCCWRKSIPAEIWLLIQIRSFTNSLFTNFEPFWAELFVCKQSSGRSSELFVLVLFDEFEQDGISRVSSLNVDDDVLFDALVDRLLLFVELNGEQLRNSWFRSPSGINSKIFFWIGFIEKKNKKKHYFAFDFLCKF